MLLVWYTISLINEFTYIYRDVLHSCTIILIAFQEYSRTWGTKTISRRRVRHQPKVCKTKLFVSARLRANYLNRAESASKNSPPPYKLFMQTLLQFACKTLSLSLSRADFHARVALAAADLNCNTLYIRATVSFRDISCLAPQIKEFLAPCTCCTSARASMKNAR